MAVADYFHRNAVAAAQIVAGFDETAFRAKLESHHLVVAMGPSAAQSPSGRLLAELVVRLVARLYPVVSLRGAGKAAAVADDLSGLARRINPNIELGASSRPTLAVMLGRPTRVSAEHAVYAGCSGWDALVDAAEPQAIGDAANPFGAGAAACLAAANIFRHVFLGDVTHERRVVFSTLLREPRQSPASVPPRGAPSQEDVLVGGGAIGNAAAWALTHCDLTGQMQLVDPQAVELSNIQRYLMTERRDEGAAKAALLDDRLPGALRFIPHQMEWASFVEANGYSWQHVLVAVDSAAARREVQASLPRWIANAWTQPEDLGVSTHQFGRGACLGCLYLPAGVVPNEDEIYAAALRIPGRQREVRDLLAHDMPLTEEFLAVVANALEVDPGPVLTYAGSSIRRLYADGLCGGMIAPMSSLHGPRHEMHVPVAHQSAMAGILLAAALVAKLAGHEADGSRVTRMDLRRPLAQVPTQPLAADPRGICMCRDDVYREAYRDKHA